MFYGHLLTMYKIQNFKFICVGYHVQLFATSWTAAQQASLSITNSWSSLELMSIESVMPSNHLIFCRSLLLLPSIFPSIRVFSNDLILHMRLPKYWSFSFSISPSNEYSGLTGLISLQPKELPRVFPNTQFKNINLSAFSLLYGLTFTSIHDYWKSHSFDHVDLCQQSNISAF